MTTFDYIYQQLVQKILQEGFLELNSRTGIKTKIITGIHFDIRAEDFPLLTLRKIPLKLFIAEQVWYVQGSKKLNFFQKFSKIWDDFKEDNNTVDTAYGYRWRNYFKRDQLESLIKMLKTEASSRQGVVITWDPDSDGLASPKKKNVPCVPMWVANIVNDELNFHIIFRSQDVMLGLPHDVGGFALLQHMIAQHLGIATGWLHYSISHAHIYENHFAQAEEIAKRSNDHPEIKLELPANSFVRAEMEDEQLVGEIYSNLKGQYHPLSKLSRMKIAL